MAMKVLIRGTEYPSARAAADALGVSVATVYCAIIRRDPDSIGLGRGKNKTRRAGGLPPKPVIVAGRKFASIADLARFLSRDPHDVRQSLKRGRLAHERIVLAVMKQIAKEENAARRAADKLGDDQ